MKKCLAAVLISILVLSVVAACNQSVKANVDTGKTISASVDREFVIAVDSNPTTGFDWEAGYDDSKLVLVGKEYKPDEKASGLVGAGGTKYFRFKALETGKTEITLTYKRPWETEIAEQKVFNVAIK